MVLLLCLSLNSVSAIEGNIASQACRFDVDGLGLSGYQLRHVLMSAPTRASYKTAVDFYRRVVTTLFQQLHRQPSSYVSSRTLNNPSIKHSFLQGLSLGSLV